MYRANKHFMKDPATASQRIYIGNVAETVIFTDLEERFQQYGKILGLVLRQGFAFIQYEHDYEAKAAIHNEHGKPFQGKQLNVRQAIDKAKLNQSGNSNKFPQQNQQRPAGPVQPNPQKPPQMSTPDGAKTGLLPTPPAPSNKNMPSMQDNLKVEQEAPLNEKIDKPLVKFQEHKESVGDESFPAGRKQEGFQTNDELRGGRRMEGSVHSDRSADDRRDEYRTDRKIDSFPDRDRKGEEFLERGHVRGRGGRGRGRGMLNRAAVGEKFREAVPVPPYYGRGEEAPFSAPGYVPPAVVDAPERNDCEIIVVSKLLTEYAEYIEQRLKGIGLIVDLLFPNEDVPIGRVLANISSRGCLFAILVMPQNEEHRSLTLNVLHGIPQEHRNMPIEDALVMISRNFDAYMRGEKLDNVATSNGVASITDRHPEFIQMLLNLLAENRQVTVPQYDKLIKYLEERRELQSQAEIAEGIEPAPSEPVNKQTELQNRIMSILNKSNETPKPAEPPVPKPSSSSTPLLQDPSVQKALDSLLSGEILKGISAGL